MLGLDLPKVEQERFRKWSAINLVRKKVKWLQEIHIELTADHGSVCWLHGFRDGERCAPRPRPRTLPVGMYPITEYQISCMQVCYLLRSNSYSQFIVLIIRCLCNWLDIRLSWVHYCGMVSGKSLKCKKRE